MPRPSAQDLCEKIDRISNNLTSLESELEVVFQNTSYDALSKDLDKLELVKLEMTLAYISAALYACHLKLNPKSYAAMQDLTQEPHPIIVELDRIKAHIFKIKNFEKKMSSTNGSNEKDSSTSSINSQKSTLSSFIDNVLKHMQ